LSQFSHGDNPIGDGLFYTPENNADNSINKMKYGGIMIKLSILIMTALLSIATAHAGGHGEMTAEQLVASKKKADMTYRQLMQIMGKASSMMHEGILRENKQMIKEGANIIVGHPAPKHKPWTIMRKEDHKAFKKTLKSFNKTLDQQAEKVAEEAAKDNWKGANSAAHDLMNSCITCHEMWRAKVK